eukprot:TRINITY_DN17322_c0_g1_i1.p1 TRINITY_DN17322_c0_g1~~TRINITY_DN17322_c0_g1_i1.p1  ORF type:complete len:880 (+),score=201.10 TRINITY_DN17322_c0_g1_i1:28-2667(+)
MELPESVDDLKKKVKLHNNYLHRLSNHGQNIFHSIVEHNREDLFYYLLSDHPDLDFNCSDDQGWTPLHIAAYNSNLKMCLELLNQRAVSIIRTKDGLFPIHLLAGSWNPVSGDNIEFLQVIMILFHELQKFQIGLDEETPSKDTLLHYAAKGGNVLLLRILLLNGADLHKKNAQGQTPIDIANKYHNAELIAALEDFEALRSTDILSKEKLSSSFLKSSGSHLCNIITLENPYYMIATRASPLTSSDTLKFSKSSSILILQEERNKSTQNVIRYLGKIGDVTGWIPAEALKMSPSYQMFPTKLDRLGTLQKAIGALEKMSFADRGMKMKAEECRTLLEKLKGEFVEIQEKKDRKKFHKTVIVQAVCRKWLCRRKWLDYTKRNKLPIFPLKELLETERKYVRSISILLEKFIRPLQTVSKHEYQAVYGQLGPVLEEILRISKQILNGIEDYCFKKKLKRQPNEHLGTILLTHVEFLKVYAQFFEKYDPSFVENAEKSNSDLVKDIKRFNSLPEVYPLNLQDFLAKPFQRPLKYPLLIGKMIKDMPENHEEAQTMFKAFEMFSQMNRDLNQKKGRSENQARLLKIQNSLVGLPGKLVEPSREHLMDAKVVHYLVGKSPEELKLHIFNDIVVYAKKIIMNTVKKRYQQIFSNPFRKMSSFGEEEVPAIDPKMGPLKMAPKNSSFTGGSAGSLKNFDVWEYIDFFKLDSASVWDLPQEIGAYNQEAHFQLVFQLGQRILSFTLFAESVNEKNNIMSVISKQVVHQQQNTTIRTTSIDDSTQRIEKEGVLKKKSRKNEWKRKIVRLQGRTLFYFDEEPLRASKKTDKTKKKIILSQEVVLSTVGEGGVQFSVTIKNKSHQFAAENRAAAIKWLVFINDKISTTK